MTSVVTTAHLKVVEEPHELPRCYSGPASVEDVGLPHHHEGGQALPHGLMRMFWPASAGTGPSSPWTRGGGWRSPASPPTRNWKASMARLFGRTVARSSTAPRLWASKASCRISPSCLLREMTFFHSGLWTTACLCYTTRRLSHDSCSRINCLFVWRIFVVKTLISPKTVRYYFSNL